ncbi:hypothetical protein F7725_004088 [Dissostichus mawsoni]|uniref:Uncharacterized protein n=1 Tax=Dissostichus mawsoni TaxID=36200 RepID=A0A7J5YC60_DISMA|nr:hypothetical protein F7725_004088 [Dissostichus mawsoni]
MKKQKTCLVVEQLTTWMSSGSDGIIDMNRKYGPEFLGTILSVFNKTLLKHRDPFGVHSTFYAVRCSALSVLLLMLCVAVVTVNLRTRTRDT